jgi:hypothetical protein
MADQLKEVYNNTVFIGQLTNGVTVATTNATTQLVIKDAQVSNNAVYSSLAITPTLSVNNSLTASLASSVTGSEIVDVSSSVVVSAPSTTAFSFQSFGTWTSANSSPSTVSFRTDRLVNGATAYSQVTFSSAAASTGYTPVYDFYNVGSNFVYTYWDGNSSTYLIRRVGGPNGAETVISSSSYWPWARGDTDKFHTITGSNVRTYSSDTTNTTNVAITHPNWNGGTTSYPRSAFANGLLFYSNDSYGTNVCWAINPTTGFAAYITIGSQASWAQNTYFDVCFIGGFYYIIKSTDTTSGAAGTFYVYRVADFGPLTSGNISAGTVSGTTIQSISYVPAVGNFSHAHKLDKTNGDIYYLLSTSGTVYTYRVVNAITGVIKPNFVVTMGSINATHNTLSAPATGDDSANKLNTTLYPTSMRLRITGVQSTL